MAAAVRRWCGRGVRVEVTVVRERVNRAVMLASSAAAVGAGEGAGMGVLLEVALGTRERGIDDVAKVWLQADVQEAEHREQLVDGAAAQPVVVEVVGYHKVLEALQQLHGKEEEHAARELDVLSARVDPNRHEQPEERKTERGLLVEAHGGLLVGLEPGVPGCDATPLDDASSHTDAQTQDRGSGAKADT